MANDYKGLFLVFEGGEGSGKSTQARMLSEFFTSIAVPNILTCEPGDTKLGADLRTILLDRDREPVSRRAEALLFAADRAEHVDKVILPALKRGDVVICDRYIASSVAYQSYAGGLSEGAIKFLSGWGSGGLYPDATYFLNINPERGLERARQAKPNRFEDKGIAYHDRVRHGFRDQMDDTWVHIDSGRAPIDVVHEIVVAHATRLYRDKKWAQGELERVIKDQEAPRMSMNFYRRAAGMPSFEDTFKRSLESCPICNEDLRVYTSFDAEPKESYLCPNGHGQLVFQQGGI
jgi:dTMP kinase